MAPSDSLVLVTGASGFLGSHVVHQLLEKGYRVRGTARSAKVALLQDGYGHYKSQFEAVPVEDVASDDLSEVLKGVNAIVHVAAPLPGRADAQGLLDGAINGALNVLRQGQALGIKKFVVTSSNAAVNVPGAPLNFSDHVFTENDWNTATREEALDGTRSPMWIYAAAKTLAERAVWKFAEQHTDVDVTTLNPPFIYGPFAPGFRAPEPSTSAISTNANVYVLITGTAGGDMPPTRGTPRYVDVRDVAQAHVAALTAPPSTQVGRKRILIAGGWFDWADAVEHIAAVRPELKKRLPSTANARRVEGKIGPIDTTRAREVLGIKEFIDWKDCVVATIDSLVELEKNWESKGYKI